MEEARGRVEVWLNVQKLKEASSEVYMEMALRAQGLMKNSAAERSRKGAKDLSNLVSQRWSSLELPPAQIATLFNTFVRSKYRYGLFVTG